jgi:uncharacterized protein (DUF1015 family)
MPPTMAEIRPLRAIHYAPGVTLDDVVAPPYDVIDDEQRAALLARSPTNVVEIDLPQGDEPYDHAGRTLEAWLRDGVLVRDDEPALWALTQEYTDPDGERRTRSGFFAAVRVTDYGPGRIRPHERTHPGPKEDRLRLTRATQANLSPIFSLYSDPEQAAWSALAAHVDGAEPVGETRDPDGTVNRLWRVADPDAIARVTDAVKDAELLIADGHHRYETARVYADEAGTEGAGWVLMCLVALEDPGLTVFPTHRLARGRGLERYEALANVLRENFAIKEIGEDELVPPAGGPPLELGYLDSHFKRPFRLTLLDAEIGAAELADCPPALQTLDTAVLEALLLKGVLGLTDDDISHLNDFGYARDRRQAVDLVTSGEYDVAFLLRPTPVEQVREVAASGASMPPKSTYFFPKVPTGLVINPLD